MEINKALQNASKHVNKIIVKYQFNQQIKCTEENMLDLFDDITEKLKKMKEILDNGNFEFTSGIENDLKTLEEEKEKYIVLSGQKETEVFVDIKVLAKLRVRAKLNLSQPKENILAEGYFAATGMFGENEFCEFGEGEHINITDGMPKHLDDWRERLVEVTIINPDNYETIMEGEYKDE